MIERFLDYVRRNIRVTNTMTSRIEKVISTQRTG